MPRQPYRTKIHNRYRFLLFSAGTLTDSGRASAGIEAGGVCEATHRRLSRREVGRRNRHDFLRS